MSFKTKYGPWAIIAGSAEGLGEAWSITLAKKGLNIIMIDHQEDKLATLSEKIRTSYNVETITVTQDLSAETASDTIMARCKELEIGLLVYNAAYSRVKPFMSNTDMDFKHYTGINTYTQLKMIHAFSDRLINANRPGGIILMSSLAGLIGMQLVSTYAATKAFAWNLAEALHYELKPHQIDVLACIAGATSTPAYIGTNPTYGRIKPQVMNPVEVSEEGLRKLGKKARHICGWSNRLNYFFLTRILPRKLAAGTANSVMKKMYSDD